jgi:hypothetical protein
MSRRRRWLIGVLLAVLALPLLLVAWLAFQLSPGRLKPRLERQLQDTTGLVLRIDGDLEWHAWPLLRVSVGEARVMAPGAGPAAAAGGAGGAGAAAAPFARWRRLEAVAQWQPLLHGVWSIEGLKLAGLEVALQRGPDGAIAWPKLKAASAAAAGAAKPAREIGTVTLGRVELIDAAVRVEGAAGAGGEALALEALRLQSGVEFDSATGTLKLRDFALRGTAHAAPLPPAGVPVALSASQLVLQQAPLRVEPTVVTARIGGLEGLGIAAHLDEVADLTAPSAAGRLELETPSVRAFAQRLGVELPPTRDATVFGPMALATTWRLNAQGVVLDPLRAEMDGNVLTGSARVPPGWAPGASGQPADSQSAASQAAARPPARFELAGDRVDFDRYLRPKDQPGEPFELPVERLRALHIEGEVRLKEARLLGNRLRGVRLRVIDKVGAKP